MILQRMASAIKRQDWFQVNIEVLIVVIGIFLGLQVQAWYEEQNDRVLEQTYLENLLRDFSLNKDNLSVEMASTTKILHDMESLISQTELVPPTLYASELNDLLRSIHIMPTFNDSNPTYSNLTGSGELRLITDNPLKDAMANYYAGLNVLRTVQQTHEMELVETFQPYIIDNMEFRQITYNWLDDFKLPVTVNDDEILKVINTRKFRNVIVQKWAIAADLLAELRKTNMRNEQVLSILDESSISGEEIIGQ